MPLPGSWGELYGRWALLLAVDDLEVELWLRQVLEATYGVTSLRAIDRRTRALVFQRACGVLYALEEDDRDLAFVFDQRETVQRVIARFFGGIHVAGPPWRLSPTDVSRPPRSEFFGDVDFE